MSQRGTSPRPVFKPIRFELVADGAIVRRGEQDTLPGGSVLSKIWDQLMPQPTDTNLIKDGDPQLTLPLHSDPARGRQRLRPPSLDQIDR
jgi:hypothetical protein